MKVKTSKFNAKKLISVIAILLVVVFVTLWVLQSCKKNENVAIAAEYEPFTVTRGDVIVSVTGSGTVQPIEQYEIQSIVTGDIIEDYVTLGAEVNKDDVLYVIDSESAENSIERAETSYEQQVISHNQKVKNFNEEQKNRTVYAPVSGVITQLYVENGDEIKAGTAICEIKNSDVLTVRVPFLASNAAAISHNQSATIYFDDRNESHTGYVSHVATGTYATETGAVVSDVEITFNNPGAILPGETVTATVGSFACNDFGTVEEAHVETISAKVAGDVEGLNFSKGDKISGGALLLKITDDDVSNDLTSSELSLKNAKLSLEDQIERLNDYTITSPISGTVISKTMKGGDTLDGNKSSLAIVADMSKLTFEISVDELYIRSISVGQTVQVTADALPNKVFEGVVDNVSIIGTATSGVTVYPVTVVISEYDELLPGMNVDAEIVISNANDVLMIPVNAVVRGSLVLVKEDSGITGITAPSGRRGENARPKGDASESDIPRPTGDAPEGFPAPGEMTPPEGFTPPEGMTPPEGFTPREGMTPPEGFTPPEGMTPPEKTEKPEASEPAKEDKTAGEAPAEGRNAEMPKMRIPEAPAGYKYVMIETGEANDNYVEVVSGLSEGDVIYVTVVKNTTASQAGGFGMGGMRGGMPAMGGMGGGMPPMGAMGGGMGGNRSMGGMSGSRSMGGMR